MSFPAESVPDDALLAPHHALWALYLVLLATAVVWDDYAHKEPLLTTALVLLALFAWAHVWKWYPALGAGLFLASLVTATLSVLLAILDGTTLFTGWAAYPLKWRIFVLAMLLVAMDDAVSHALGWPTPGDWVWERFLVPHL